MDGLINIYKEKGFTSHDVVAKMRGILHMKKIGHTGTLDPDATGVLPVCIGKGTRLCSLLENHDKTYETVLLLGKETDTQDISGKILSEKPVCVKEEEVRQVLERFHGTVLQVPPMYSARKIKGKKLYEYAREGKVIEREARPVQIDELCVLNMALPRIKLRVSCSKGTYIRTLCHDIGQVLGCGGCMEELVRTRVGNFKIEHAITLGELEANRDTDQLGDCLVTLEEVFQDLPVIHTEKKGDVLLHNGNRLKPELLTDPVFRGRIRMYDSSDVFFGVYEYDPAKGDFKPFKMFR